MRRKDILIPFKEIFGEFLTENGYVFIKNGFVKYNNGVINMIGIYSRKHIDIVEIDIVFYSENITQIFLDDLTVENEDWFYRLSQIEFHKNFDGIHYVDYWEYELDNPKEPQKTLSKMLETFKENFDTYFNPVDLDDLNKKRQKYNNELFDYAEPTEYELLSDAFTQTSKDDFGIPLNKTIEKYKELFINTLSELKRDYFDFCERIYQENLYDIDYLKHERDSLVENRELISAFLNDDCAYVSQIAESRRKQEKDEIKKNTENNLTLLKKYNLV